LCRHLTSYSWLAGLLGGSISDELDRTAVDELLGAETARLILVDYAETRVEQLSALVPLLAANATLTNPVRVVLTVRTKRPGRDWSSGLLGGGDAFDIFVTEAGLDVLSEHPLEGNARAALFLGAHQAFVDCRTGSGGTASAVGSVPAELGSDAYSSPLMVVIGAYLAAEDAIGPPATSDELLDGLLDHEGRYWRQIASSVPVAVDNAQSRRVVALATVGGADSESEAARLVSLLTDFSDAPAERRAQLARFGAALYPGERYWNQLEPDRVGEHLVATTFGNDPHLLTAVLGDRDADALTHSVRLLSRAAANNPSFAKAMGQVLDTRLCSLCQAAVDQVAASVPDRLLTGGMLAPALAALVQVSSPSGEEVDRALGVLPPRPDLVLDALAEALTLRQVAHLRDFAGAGSTPCLPKLAAALTNLSLRLGALGRADEGVSYASEAVEIFRNLAEANAVPGRLNLARSLDNLSLRFGQLGRSVEGLNASKEAVRIFRDLDEAKVIPGSALPDVANALDNLSNRLADVGD
jgi:tetratricopeptide (TPR) repeat protein